MHRRIQQPLGSFDWKDWLVDSPAMNPGGKGFYCLVQGRGKTVFELPLSFPSQKQWIRDAQLLERCLAVNAAAAFSAWDLGVLVATPG